MNSMKLKAKDVAVILKLSTFRKFFCLKESNIFSKIYSAAMFIIVIQH